MLVKDFKTDKTIVIEMTNGYTYIGEVFRGRYSDIPKKFLDKEVMYHHETENIVKATVKAMMQNGNH